MSEPGKRLIFLAAFAAVLAALTAAAYQLTERFLKDRQVAVAQLTRPTRQVRTTVDGGRRRTFPPGTTRGPVSGAAPAGVAPSAAGEAAIQRQLKTLDEINRINERNRQLMDQQRRLQNQR